MLDKRKYGVGKVLGYVIKSAWKERPTIFLIYFVQLIAACIGKLQVILLPKFLIDELTLLMGSAKPMEHIRMVVLYAVVIVASHLVGNILNNLVQWRKEPLREWLNFYLEERLAEHTMSMDFEHTEDPKALEQVAKARDGISWYSGGIVGILDEFYAIVQNVIVLLGVIFVIVLKCPMLLPVQLAALALISFFNARINKNEIEHYAKLSKTNRMFGYILYSLADFSYGKDIRLYDSADMMREKGNVYIKTSIGNWAAMAKFREKNRWYMDGVNTIRDGISYFYIGYLAIKKLLTLGDFTMCVSAASNLYWSLFYMVEGIQNIVKKCNYLADFLKMLDYPAAMEKGTKETKDGEHVIEFCNVSFKYPRSENYVLRNINLTIRSGEHLSIVGLNGAGKTTLVKLLCRLYDVTEGEIKIDGINIKEYSEEAYRKLFSVVFQDFQLFAFSLKENIQLAEGENGTLTEESGAIADVCEKDRTLPARIEEVLQLSGLYEDAMKLPKGVDTMIYKSFDEDGVELSGGQKQKTAIARALYRNAPIVILDEPTAALDPVAEYEIYRRFDELVGGKTAIYISHRLSSCKFCDRIAVFADDTIKEYGTHDALVGLKDGIYAEMFAAQAQYYVENASEAVA